MASNRGSVPWLQDADVTLYHGDVLTVLPSLEAESVDCVVTSPPYWGLRDYGTGAWEGGDAECDHVNPSTNRTQNMDKLGERYSGGGHKASSEGAVVLTFRDVCGKCGATRIDQQLGLEPTPDCGRREMYRLRSDLSEDQRAFVLQRLMAVEGRPDA